MHTKRKLVGPGPTNILFVCAFRVCVLFVFALVEMFFAVGLLLSSFLKKTVWLSLVCILELQVASDLAEATIDGGGKVKGRRTRKAADKKDQQEDSDDAAGLFRFCTLLIFHLLVSATTPQLISGVMAYKCVAIVHKTLLYAKFSTSTQPTCIHLFTFALPYPLCFHV